MRFHMSQKLEIEVMTHKYQTLFFRQKEILSKLCAPNTTFTGVLLFCTSFSIIHALPGCGCGSGAAQCHLPSTEWEVRSLIPCIPGRNTEPHAGHDASICHLC